MTYTLLSVLGIAAAAIAYFVANAKASQVGKRLLPLGLPLALLSVITLVGDNIMISANLYSYQHDAILGIFIGQMPIEDFSYPLITALLVSSLGGARER